MVDYKKIEKKWQRRWEKESLFETEVNNQKKFFITVPYPYINGPPHIGFLYTISRGDMIARFKRMQGHNVLFPQGLHATGEPLAGAAKRVERGEENIIKSLKASGVPEEEIDEFARPEKFVEFYYNEWVSELKKTGLAIDWRRTFHTTSLNPCYNEFVKWQFKRLKELELIEKGSHPVIYCPSCESPTSAHDRQEGENAEIIDYNLILIEGNNYIYPAATLRPETIYGATNMWINPNVEYIIAKKDGKGWILSKSAFEKLNDQGYSLKESKRLQGKELIGKKVEIPVINRKVPVLPANFVDPENGTGVVMSVPAHAPYDYIGLVDLRNRKDEIGELARNVDLVAMIEVPGFEKYPAKEICERIDIKSQAEEKKLEEATEEIYEKEFHKGILRDNCGKFAGKKVISAKEALIDNFKRKNMLEKMYETSEKVVCRCMTECHVKTIKNQYFLKYGDPRWKSKVKEALRTTTEVIPEQAENDFRARLEKMKNKPCARQSGLGTPLPWNKEWIIEPLSDSTIYMAYYILSKYIEEGKINEDNLNPKFFDYIYLGKGKAQKIAEKSGISKKLLNEIRNEFEYFYPVNVRNSAKDLITNHLIYYLYNHVAIWDKEKWPEKITTNGFVMLKGKELSKSKGHFITIEEAVRKFDSDPTRLALLDTNEGLKDINFKPENANSFREKLKGIFEEASKVRDHKKTKEGLMERWLESKLQERIKRVTEALEQFKNRTALEDAFHGAWRDISFYISRRAEPDEETSLYAFSVLARLLVPFAPHGAEEIWERIGKEGFVHEAKWPRPRKKYKDNEVIGAIKTVENTRKDINEILKIIDKKEPEKIMIFVAKRWKRDLFRDLKEKISEEDKSFDQVKRELMKKSKYRTKGKQAIQIMQKVFKDPSVLPKIVSKEEKEKEYLEKNKFVLKNIFGADIEIVKEEKAKQGKAKKALPSKPAILIQ